MDIRLANRNDIGQVMALESRNYFGNLEPSQRADGYISILHSKVWFEAAVDSAGLHVAVDDQDSVVGFIAVTDPPTPETAATSPIMRAILESVQTATFDGKPIAQQ